MSERILVIIPALDAARSIGRVVKGCLEHLPDVVVVNDGSTDDTHTAAMNAGARVVDHPVNRGKGAALKGQGVYCILKPGSKISLREKKQDFSTLNT